MASLSSAPELPVPDRKCQVTFTLTESGTNFARVWATGAPPGSELRVKLDKTAQQRLEVFESESPTDHTWETTFDVGGRYTFVVQEYTLGSAGSKGYEGAPGTAPLETAVGSEYTLTLDIGQKMTAPVGTQADAATLVVWVWNATIRPTTLATHGEATPAIVAESPTPKMAVVMESTAVLDAVEALANVTVSTAIGNITTIVADMVLKINRHHNVALDIHAIGDSDNSIPEQFSSTMAPSGLPEFVNIALNYLKRHRHNDDGSGVVGAGGYHEPSGVPKADFASAPIIESVGGLAEAYAALAEIYRSHRNHQPHYPTIGDYPGEYHGAQISGSYDPTFYDMTTLPLLLQVHLAVFDVLASFNSSTPPTQTTGAMLLIEQAGFVEE